MTLIELILADHQLKSASSAFLFKKLKPKQVKPIIADIKHQ